MPQSPRRVLDPVARASEILFGLIMVLTFTLSLGFIEADRTDVTAVLLGAVGCNLAWAIIDAAMYLLGEHGERSLAATALRTLRDVKDPAAGRALVADHLPSILLPALTEADLERFRRHLCALPAHSLQPRLERDDFTAAFGVFLLVFLCLLPVALPFLVLDDIGRALRVSNVIAVTMLFLTGFTFGRQAGRPWQSGVGMVVIGATLVGVAMLLGG